MKTVGDAITACGNTYTHTHTHTQTVRLDEFTEREEEGEGGRQGEKHRLRSELAGHPHPGSIMCLCVGWGGEAAKTEKDHCLNYQFIPTFLLKEVKTPELQERMELRVFPEGRKQQLDHQPQGGQGVVGRGGLVKSPDLRRRRSLAFEGTITREEVGHMPNCRAFRCD